MLPAWSDGAAEPDYEAIRAIMHRIRSELTVPDRARLALGLVAHLATRMTRRQMRLLLDQLREEASRIQEVPPQRRHLRLEHGGEEAWLRP